MISLHIKATTMAAHLELEKIVVLKLEAIRSEVNYAGLLGYFYSYFSALEKAIAPFINETVLPDFAQRRKSERLKTDLVELGGSSESLPQPKLPEISSTAQALGALYVMEGSIMGGSVIVQMLAKHGICKGVSFFSGYGPETGKMWKAFQDALEAYSDDPEAASALTASALATFSRFSEFFGEPQHAVT
ncbi:heme oxygenase [Parapedobacter koreensis]|uniref:Heme oxygenase n=2 Tax=Parapedobacter koreensis TaxID=332977 RepID=A0A1H7SJF6_9SPHI|nr:heme oxygenase [Parapedobacter koreensis]